MGPACCGAWILPAASSDLQRVNSTVPGVQGTPLPTCFWVAIAVSMDLTSGMQLGLPKCLQTLAIDLGLSLYSSIAPLSKSCSKGVADSVLSLYVCSASSNGSNGISKYSPPGPSESPMGLSSSEDSGAGGGSVLLAGGPDWPPPQSPHSQPLFLDHPLCHEEDQEASADHSMGPRPRQNTTGVVIQGGWKKENGAGSAGNFQ